MKLMAIDGNSIVNRAFYGVKLLSTRDGRYTNAIYGFLTILLKLLDEEQPEGLCVTFDRKAPTFRHTAYEGYKANRHPMPEELAQQMPVLKEVLAAMNIPMYELDGWEADDLLGTISRKCEAAGWDCIISTGDKDSLQLVTDHTTVKLVTSRMGQTTTTNVTPEVFRAQYGFDPIHMIDLKALMGDSSDNYPGVKGIGEKTAMGLVQQYGSVEELYARFDEIPLKPAQRKRLDEGREDARLSYDLATIRTDAPIDFAPEQAKRRCYDNDKLYSLFLDLEFSKLIARFGLTPPEASPVQAQEEPEARAEVVEVTTEAQFQTLLPKWQAADYVVVLPQDDLAAVLVGLEGGEGQSWLYDIRWNRYEGDYNALLRALFSKEVKKAAHCVKELCNQLLRQGLPAEGFVFDTALGAYLLEPTAGSYDLHRLAMTYFKRDMESGPQKKAEDGLQPLSDDLKEQTARYEDSALIAALRDAEGKKLEEYGLTSVLTDIELPLCPVLAEMERAGVLVDRQALVSFGEMLQTGIAAAQSAIYGYAGEEFNINSTQQLGHILFDKLQLPAYKKTKRGYSTSAEVLEKLEGHHPIIGEILEYRQLTKLKSTYVDGLTKVIEPDGRIRTSFQNTVTATGRLSSVEPNLQNIPVRTPLGAEMRKMFIAAPGNVLVDADYSQIELRLLAHIADDKAMQEGFNSLGVDIHTATAAQVFGVPLEDVTREMRSAAKAVNFGIVYGISAYSLAQDLHVTVAEAKDYMERYFATYSGVRAYQKAVVEQAKADGYVSTLAGRRRWLPELKSSNFNLRSFGERVALNMPIQGTAADIIKLAMIRVQDRLKAEGLQGRLVLQVHDELIVECPEAEGQQVAQLLEEEMEQVISLKVPLVAEAKVGHSWADAH
ncbi:MAG: DNA polymerase I [Clostridiales bacterium]|nr:DNA polymerase I [Clostridiales bacterium]